MPRLVLRAHRAERKGGCIAISFSFTEEEPFPSKIVQIRTASGALAALEAYVKEAASTGKGLRIYASIMRGDRAPSGFRKLDLFRNVNL